MTIINRKTINSSDQLTYTHSNKSEALKPGSTITLEAESTRYTPTSSSQSGSTTAISERSVTTYENKEPVKSLKDTMKILDDCPLYDILDTIYEYYITKSEDKKFYYYRLLEQKDTSLNIDFLHIIFKKIDGNPLNSKDYYVLYNVVSMITTKNLFLGAKNSLIYDTIYKLVEYLAKYEVFYAITSLINIAKYVKERSSLIAEKNARQILEKIHNIIKNSITANPVSVDDNPNCKEIMAKKISEMLQQLVTLENKNSLIGDWLNNEKLSKEFKEILHVKLKDMELVCESEYAELEQSCKTHETISPNNSDQDKSASLGESVSLQGSNKNEIEVETELKTLDVNTNSLDVKKFENFLNETYPLKSFINYLNKLEGIAFIDLLNQDFTDYLNNQNQDVNFFTGLFSDANIDLYSLLVEMIFQKISTINLTDDTCKLLGNIVYHMHLTILKSDHIPSKLYDTIYQLMNHVAKTNVEEAIFFLQEIQKKRDKSQFHYSTTNYMLYQLLPLNDRQKSILI